MLLIEKNQSVAVLVALSAALTGSLTTIMVAVKQRKTQVAKAKSSQGPLK